MNSFTFFPRTQPGNRGSVLILIMATLVLLALMGTAYLFSARSDRFATQTASQGSELDQAVHTILDGVSGRLYQDTLGTPDKLVLSPTAVQYDGPTTASPSAISPDMTLASGGYVLTNTSLSATTNTTYFSQVSTSSFDPATGNFIAITPLCTSTSNQFNVINDTRFPVFDSFAYLLPGATRDGTRFRYGLRVVDTNRFLNLNTIQVIGASGTLKNPDIYGEWLSSLDAAAVFGTTITSDGLSLHGASTAPTGTAVGRCGYGTSADTTTLYTSTSYFQDTLPGYQAGNQFFAKWNQILLSLERPQYRPLSANGLYLPFQTTSGAVLTFPKLSLFGASDETELRAYGTYGTPGYTARVERLFSNDTGTSNSGNTRFQDSSNSWVGTNNSRQAITCYSWDRNIRSNSDVPSVSQVKVSGVYRNTAGSLNSQSTTAKSVSWLTSNGLVVKPRQINLNYQRYPGQCIQVDNLGNYSLPQPVQNQNPLTNSVSTTDEVLDDIVCSKLWVLQNLLTIMNGAGYTADQQASFAVNFIFHQLTGCFVFYPPGGVNPEYYIPYLDVNGLVFRVHTGTNFFTYLVQFTGNPAAGSNRYFPYVPHPLINKVAVSGNWALTPALNAPASALVELLNPYSGNDLRDVRDTLDGVISLRNLFLMHGTLSASNSGLAVLPLYNIPETTGTPTPLSELAPGTRLTVVTAGQKSDFGSPTGLVCDDTPGSTVLTGLTNDVGTNALPSSTVYVAMKYVDNGGVDSYFPVDGLSFSNVTTATATNQVVARLRSQSANRDWTTLDSASERGPVGPALKNTFIFGGADTTNGTGAIPTNRWPSYPIDRFYLSSTRIASAAGSERSSGYPFRSPGDGFYNIGDFNSIPRVSPFRNGATSYSYLSNNAAVNAGAGTQILADGLIYFDFLSTTAPNPQANILPYLVFHDRASDAVDLGGGTDDLAKLRIPGRINVNTAPKPVLESMLSSVFYASTLAYLKSGETSTTAAASLAADLITARASTPSTSRADILSKINTWANPSAPTIRKRDFIWSSIFNYATVRSDTFAVYGYVEAVKYNKSYVGSFLNSSSWYDTQTTQYSDDLAYTGTSIPLIRTGRKRFIAIIDRSNCNAGIWTASTAYAVNDVVAVSSGIYKCTTAQPVSSPAPSSSNTNWTKISNASHLPQVVAYRELPN